MERHAVLVHGYITDVDECYADLAVPMPVARLAVAFWGYDDLLVLDMCRTLARQGRVEVKGAICAAGLPLGAAPLEDLALRWSEDPDSEEHDLFDRMLVFEADRVTTEVVTVPYFAFGGPWPYHDSTTLEIFVPESRLAETTNALRAVLHSAGREVEEIHGQPTPHFTPQGRFSRACWKFEKHILPKVIWVLITVLLLVFLYAHCRVAVDGPGPR